LAVEACELSNQAIRFRFFRLWERSTECSLVVTVVALPDIVADLGDWDAASVGTHELVGHAEVTRRNRRDSGTEFTLIFTLHTVVSPVAHFLVRDATSISASEFIRGAFNDGGSWGVVWFAEGCFIFSSGTVPSSVAHFEQFDAGLVSAQELVFFAGEWRNGGGLCRAELCFVLSHLAMPASIAHELGQNAGPIRARELVVVARRCWGWRWRLIAEVGFIFSLFAVPMSIANPCVADAITVAGTQEFVHATFRLGWDSWWCGAELGLIFIVSAIHETIADRSKRDTEPIPAGELVGSASWWRRRCSFLVTEISLIDSR
jgi:hypothetical protein